jgi:membrane protease YdiL (CAAX protease family)
VPDVEGEAVPIAPVRAIPLEAEPAVAAQPRFCTKCGTAWEAAWVECAVCARRRAAPVAALPLEDGTSAIKSAAALYFSLLLVCMIGTIASAMGAREVGVDIGVSIGISAVTLGWCVASWRAVLPLLREVPAIGWFAAGIGLSFVTFAVGAMVIGGVMKAFHLPREQMSKAFLEGGFGWGTVLLVTCVQPAVIEELAFRGVVIGALRRALSPVETVLVSALMFMILHLSPLRFPHTLALGLAAGYLRVRTKSIYPCIALHFAHNLMCIGAEWAGMF